MQDCDTSQVDFSREFVFLSKTDEELSLVCETDFVPSNAEVSEANWQALKISGVLDFGMVGVIARLTGILADEKIAVFVISTFNTDYILLKADTYDRAVAVLRKQGYLFMANKKR